MNNPAPNAIRLTQASLQRLAHERIHLVLLADVERGLADVASGATRGAREALDELKREAKDA